MAKAIANANQPVVPPPQNQYVPAGWQNIKAPTLPNLTLDTKIPYTPGYTPEMGDTEGYNKFKSRALSTGPSPWLSMTKYANDLKEMTQREGAKRESNASTSEQLSRLGAQGGITSGARERAGEAGAKNYLGMSQNLTREGNINDLQTDIADQTNKLSMLSQLPGLENQRIQAQVDENVRRQGYNKDVYQTKKDEYQTKKDKYDMEMNRYNAQMQAEAAERQARATENSGKK